MTTSTYVFNLQDNNDLAQKIDYAFEKELARNYGVAHTFMTEKTLILVFAPKVPQQQAIMPARFGHG
jgi:hypothetical protein